MLELKYNMLKNFIILSYKKTFHLSLLIGFAFSQNMKDFEKLKKEYNKQQNSSTSSTLQENIDINFDENSANKMVQLTSAKDSDDTLKFKNHFGYSFFTKRDTSEFWENLPAPDNYIIGSGDELIITLWGQTKLRKNYIVTREGKIYDQEVGALNVSGKSLIELRKYLMQQFGKTYSTLRGSNPTSFLDVSLGNLRLINVNFVGELITPGVYPLHPFSNLILGLIQAGGVDTTGTLRKIEIIREGNEKKVIDLYDYFLNGAQPKKIQLRDQDVVFVPYRTSSVKIDSSVRRPMIYEHLENENLKDVLEFAGGLKTKASNKIAIRRIIPLDQRISNDNNHYNLIVDYKNSSKVKIFNGDHIIVREILMTPKTVEVIGQVKKPGKYEFFEGMVLNDLLMLAGGLEDTTFVKSIYLNQAEIIRRDIDTRYEKTINIDLRNLEDLEIKNFRLQNLDRFVVHANLNFYERENVKIFGEVNIPGSYPISFDNEPLSSLISKAGGYTSKALKNGVSIYRNIDLIDLPSTLSEDLLNETNKNNRKRVAWTNDKITMLPGDSVIVRAATMSITVLGSVYNPGIVEFKQGKSANYYINYVGGINEKANKKGIIIIKPNGVVVPKKWYYRNPISDGSVIYVTAKQETEPLNLTQFATNWTSIISSMITAVVLSQQLN